MNPDIVLVNASSAVLLARDVSDSRFYIFATLQNGVLRFEVVAQLSTGARGSVSGRDFFEVVMNHFGPRVRAIAGNWDRTSGRTTNLDQFNRATAAGVAPDAAAEFTWTGLRAAEYGFDKVTVISADRPSSSDPYDHVRVEFRQ